ncbi:hypothetical protein IQ06DRAFT_363118 [Phaeosphaeriaceae sp. SRC1lsM3a]|nr:hypothetical protein IQ06DRAFT_363118 [Stagonospora sp. SRC1lsM3a]
MHASTVLAALAAIVSPALADFYLYAGTQSSTIDGTTLDSFVPFTGPPDCNDVFNGPILTPSSDVSGNKRGVRCKGCSSAYGSEDMVKVTELEMNHADYGHWTFYADRGGDMVDLDGNLVGNCVVDGSDGYTCTDGMAGYSGRSQLRCTTGLIIP